MSAAAAESAARMESGFLAGPENTGLDEAVQPVLIGRLGHGPRGRPRARDLAYLHLVKHLGDHVGVGAEGAGLRGQLVQPVEGPVTVGRPGWPAVAHAGVVLEQAGDAALEAVRLGEGPAERNSQRVHTAGENVQS
jgi:hypothetical protein